MQIIDFSQKGNVVRFYLGKNGNQWGDDWNDAPYECNAETVYDEFVEGYKDISFPFDDLVLQPCAGRDNSWISKEDMIKRKVPCLIWAPKSIYGDSWREAFTDWVGADGIIKYYFGDDIGEPDGIGMPD